MQGRTGDSKDMLWSKRRFYISSLTLLFLLIFLVSLDFSEFLAWVKQERTKEGLLFDIVVANLDAVGSFACWLICKEVTKNIDKKYQGSLDGKSTIKTIENEEFEDLTFLTTYIIPLVCLDFSKFRYWIVLAVLLIIIGKILVRTDKYYANPTLAVMGYRLYRAKMENSKTEGEAPNGEGSDPGGANEIVLITKVKLKQGVKIRWKKIDENVWYAMEEKNEGAIDNNN